MTNPVEVGFQLGLSEYETPLPLDATEGRRRTRERFRVPPHKNAWKTVGEHSGISKDPQGNARFPHGRGQYV